MRGESRSVGARDEGTWTKAKAKTMKASIALGRKQRLSIYTPEKSSPYMWTLGGGARS